MSDDFIIDTIQNIVRDERVASQDPFHHLPAAEWVQKPIDWRNKSDASGLGLEKLFVIGSAYPTERSNILCPFSATRILPLNRVRIEKSLISESRRKILSAERILKISRDSFSVRISFSLKFALDMRLS